MLSIFQAIPRVKLWKSNHFWTIIAITVVIILIYQNWPWREWQFTSGVWQWFPWLSALYSLARIEFMNHIVGMLFFIPIIYAVVLFSWRGALVTSFLSLVGVMPIIINMWAMNALITNITLLLMPLLVISIAVIEIEGRRKERRIFAERAEERRVYTLRVIEAQEEERHRISQDIHDETIQTLLAIANKGETLVSVNNINEAQGNGAWIRDTTISAVDKLRSIALDLRPTILDQLGLLPALRWLASHMNTDYDIYTQIIVKGTKRNLPPQVEVNIFRIVQEALSNIQRHAKASEVVVSLEFAAKDLKITIKDDGQGFEPPKVIGSLAAKGELGLIGIEERIHSLGGTFLIHSKRHAGTSLLIDVKC